MDPYANIAALYDCEHDLFDEDISFYINLLDTGPVLEVGAGTGRIMRALVDAGLEVWGVEPSQAMRERARLRLDEASWRKLIDADMTGYQLDRRFGSIIFGLNTLWHTVDSAAQLHALRLARAHALGDAILVIDVSNPVTLSDRGAHGEVRQRFRGECEGADLTVLSAAWDDEGEQRLDLELTYDLRTHDGTIRRTQSAQSLRYVYRSELELMLRLAGWQPTHVYGSYDLEPFSSRSTGIIMVAQPAPALANP
jgi:SAM-dependent methyltransferase